MNVGQRCRDCGYPSWHVYCAVCKRLNEMQAMQELKEELEEHSNDYKTDE